MSKLDLSIIVKFVDRATQPIRQFQQNVQSTNQSIDRLTHSIDRLERSLNGGRSFKQYSRNLQTGSSNLNQHSGALNTMHNGYDRVANVLDKVRNKTQAWSDSLKANRAQMREEFKSLAMNSVIAGAGLYQFLKPAVDFEKQMSGVQSVLDLEKQSKAMQQLTADARKWGAASSFSPGEAAQAQFALASGGFNADQIHKSLGGTLHLAEAGKVELERAAQIAVGTLNGFGLAASEIGRVNDVFLKGTNLTATSVDGLGETMKYVAPIAKAYGASIEQATAMTGLLGNNNILDTQAGTSLRSIMTRFAGPPKEATKAFAKLKIETKDNNGNLRDMSDILAEVNKATKNMGSGERLDIFKDIAGQEAVSAFAVLVDQSALLDKNSGKTVNKIKELTKELENSKGAAARAAAILKDNLAGDIEQLGGSIQDLSISVLNAIGTDIRGFVTGLGAFIDRIKDWVDANPELVRTIANLAMKLLMFKVAMLSVRYTGNLLFGTIFSMVAGITKFALFMWIATKVLGKFGIGMPSRFTLISTAVRVLGNAFMFLSRQALPLLIAGLRTLAIALLTNPISWIIAGVVGLAYVIWKFWGPIKAFFVGFWDGLKIGLAPLIDSLSSAWSSLKTTMSPLLPLWNGLVSAFNWVKDAISGLFTPFQATNAQLQAATANGKSFGQVIGTIIGVVGMVILKIVEFGATLFNIVGTVIGNTVGVLVTTFSNLPAFFNNIWAQIKTAFSGGIAGIGALIINWSPIGLFYSAFAAVLSWFGIDLPAKFTGFGAMILEGLKNGILSKVQAVKDALSSAVTGVIDKAKSILDVRSPSRVFAEIGDFTMQGMAVGLLNSSDLPIKALDQTHQKIVQTDIARPNIRSSQPVRAKSNSAIQVAGDTVTIQMHVAHGQNIQQIQSMLENMLNKREREKMARVRSSFKDQE
ncbi:phage tail tape measure protein, TP901 family, core region [Acinetobacter sp. CIP 102529]|uniref:phage tail tape measure protein n=1 Tax=Acinetobacter sp. CIP 102529 TaxID=1144668 RepID=UPI0002CFBAE8|nr:phage tail tape measure protein [Acinetobacter sp. CIP 102529]ENU88523.1 phage tail tape measure protein, TP901 family, core region [Acinetobacter sp. CIP 102529]